MKTNGNWMITAARSGVAGALALTVGCAGAQKRDAASAGELGGNPLAEVTPRMSKQPERNISSDQRADFDKAVVVYQKLRKDGPLKGGDCSEAAEAFRRTADQTNLPEARHNEAAVLLECGRKDEAARIWDKMASGSKPFGPALSSLGFLALERGDAAQAESLFTRSIQADPLIGSIPARMNLAQMLRDQARRAPSIDQKQKLNDQAVRHLRAVLALDANNLQAYARICFLYFDMNRPEAAKLIAQQALKKADEIATGKLEDDPGSLAAADDGKKAKAKKKDDEAEAPKRRQINVEGTGWTAEMKKSVALVYNTLGLVALDKKSYVDATGNFRKAVEMDPDLYEARLNLAAVSLKFRNYAVAEENFRAVLAAQPKNYDAVIGLGVALRGSKKVEDAEQQYLAAQKLDPQRFDSYFNLGLLYQEYKGSEKPTLQKAQSYYRDFLSHSGAAPQKLRKDAEKRIKDIDELFVALEEAAKLQKEAEEIQRKAEEQQRKAEEEAKKQQATGGGEAKPEVKEPAPTRGAAQATPTNTVTPPATR